MDRRALIGSGLAAILFADKSRAAGMCFPNGVCEVGIPNVNMTPAQQCEQWCWAASIQAVFGLYGHPIAQQTIVTKLFGTLVCQPATNVQIFNVINGQWMDQNGRVFSAQAQVIWDPQFGIAPPGVIDIILSDLNAGRPLISGAVGHATIVTAAQYINSPNGPIVQSVTVRDPWPYNPNKRTLRPDEVAGTRFLARVFVNG